MESRGVQYKSHNEFILQLLGFLLSHNYLIFDAIFYQQKRGTAMGTGCVPNYTNLFLGWWEDRLVFSEEYVAYTSFISFWGRYIDDIPILWEGGEPFFNDFVGFLNTNQIGMRFTSDFALHTINFLDLKISLAPDGIIHTEIYRKSTLTNRFLQWPSCHPEPLKQGIPIEQYLSARRNCSDEPSFDNECQELFIRFRNKGYPKKSLHRAYKRARIYLWTRGLVQYDVDS